MKLNKLIISFISIFFVSFNLSASVPEGAFTSLHVKAKNVDAYVNYMKENTAAFKMIDSDIAGVCVVKTGNEYPGEMFVWNAFPSVEKAFMTSELYDPMNATTEFNNLREVLYSVTWKPLKEFELNPGYERLWRIKTTDSRAFAKQMTKLEKEVQAAGHDTFMNGLFVAIGGGTYEAGTYYLKSITSNVETHGALIDDYFAGAAWGNTYREALLLIDDVVNDQFEVCEQFYTASK